MYTQVLCECLVNKGAKVSKYRWMIYITYICIFALICVKSHIGIEKSASRLHEQTNNNNVSSIIFHLSLSSEVEAPFSHAPRGCWTSCNFSLTPQIALFSLNMLEVDYVSGSDFCVNTGTISRILPLRCTLTHTHTCMCICICTLFGHLPMQSEFRSREGRH